MTNRQFLCLSCTSSLEEVCKGDAENQSELKDRLLKSVDVEYAVALFYYTNPSPLRALMQSLKYEGYTKIGEWLGSLLAHSMTKITSLLQEVDILIPVPLHPQRFKERGYNQSTLICKGIASRIGKIKINTQSLIRIRNTQKQALQSSKEARMLNTTDAFRLLEGRSLEEKHLLLVDDVCTTGSTITECVSVLQQIRGCKVSVATVALAT